MNTARFAANQTRGRLYAEKVNERLNAIKVAEETPEHIKKPVKYDLKR